jgi:hypothetical protein
MASLIPIRLVDASGKPNFLRSGSVIKSTGRDEKAEEEGGEGMWNILSKNEDLRSELGSYIPASQHINIGTTHTHTHKHVNKHTHLCTYTHTNSHTCIIYAHTIAYIHTHTHTHTQTSTLILTFTLTHNPSHILTDILTHTCTYVL